MRPSILFGVSLLLGRALCAGTDPVAANATHVYPAVTVTPAASYRINAAGEDAYTLTYTDSPTPAVVTDIPAYSNITANQISYTIPLSYGTESGYDVYAVCFYPVSGFYGGLTRYLFYVTLAFALVAREQEWLIIGALAASLTYSASSAVHAIAMSWSGQYGANPDLLVALGILGLSAALVVPLLNWSDTILNLGKDREENSVGRTIIVYWSCLIFLGYLSLVVVIAISAFTENYKPTTWYYQWFSLSFNKDVTCSPSSGVLDLTAGQESAWEFLYITDAFVEANRCTNPCSSGLVDNNGNQLFTLLRDDGDLIPATGRQVDHFLEIQNLKKNQRRALIFFAISIVYGVLVLCWVICQGMFIMFFGRRKPKEVRNLVYVKLAKFFSRHDPEMDDSDSLSSGDEKLALKPTFDPKLHRVPAFFAKFLAFTSYLWAWTASVVSALLAIGAIGVIEYVNRELPQSDQLYAIDQWGSWAATALVLLVAAAYRFQGVTEDVFVRIINKMLGLFFCCFHGRRHENRHQYQRQEEREMTNKTLLWDAFTTHLGHLSRRFWTHGVMKHTREEWNDNKEFLFQNSKAAWETAYDHTGKSHQRRRRAIASEKQKFPEGWQDKYEGWLEAEDFINAIRSFDAEYRKKNKGKRYLWQPRVVLDAPLREEFDYELFMDIFRKNRGHKKMRTTDPAGQVYSMIPASASATAPMVVDEEMGHVPDDKLPQVQTSDVKYEPFRQASPGSASSTPPPLTPPSHSPSPPRLRQPPSSVASHSAAPSISPLTNPSSTQSSNQLAPIEERHHRTTPNNDRPGSEQSDDKAITAVKRVSSMPVSRYSTHGDLYSQMSASIGSRRSNLRHASTIQVPESTSGGRKRSTSPALATTQPFDSNRATVATTATTTTTTTEETDEQYDQVPELWRGSAQSQSPYQAYQPVVQPQAQSQPQPHSRPVSMIDKSLPPPPSSPSPSQESVEVMLPSLNLSRSSFNLSPLSFELSDGDYSVDRSGGGGGGGSSSSSGPASRLSPSATTAGAKFRHFVTPASRSSISEVSSVADSPRRAANQSRASRRMSDEGKM